MGKFLVALGGPFLVYNLAAGRTSTTVALLLSSIPPIVWSIIQLIRSRTFDLVSMLVITGIALSLIATLLGGDPRLLLVRESFIAGVLGLIFLGSLLAPRPLLFYLAKSTVSTQGTAPRPILCQVVHTGIPIHFLSDDGGLGDRITD